MGIRVAVVDDNPHLSWNGRVYPANATFHRFLSAVLDVLDEDGRPIVDSIAHCVPLRAAAAAPVTLPLDERLEVVGTAPFAGIAGFVRRAPWITRRNARLLHPVIAASDLVWIKVPASNALLAAWQARRAGVPRFVYVAGRASDVVAAQERGPVGRILARLTAAGYDAIGRLIGLGARRVVVGEGLAGGRGIVTSLIEPDEVVPGGGQATHDAAGLSLAWAGRLAPGKGIEVLIEAVRLLTSGSGRTAAVRVDILGAGSGRAALEALATRLGVADRLTFHGYVADRQRYLKILASADLFVFPSPAEGFPKVVLDAMAVGLPVLAAPVGTLGELGAARLIESVPHGDPSALAAAITRLAADNDRAAELRLTGRQFAAAHTRSAEAARLVDLWREAYPGLPW